MKQVTTDELKKIVNLVVSDSVLDDLQVASKAALKTASLHGDYVKAKLTIAKLEHEALMENKQYRENAILAVTKLTRAACRMLHSDIPESYLDDEAFLRFFEDYKPLLDTEARLVTFVTSLQKRFKTRKIRISRMPNYTPYTISEIKCMIMAFNLGCSTFANKDELRSAVNQGKLKK